MGNFIVVRPRDDAIACQCSDWCDSLCNEFINNFGHNKCTDVDDLSPADTPNIITALGHKGDLICYFGHGDECSWLTKGVVTIDSSNILSAQGKAVVSIACKTGKLLGSDAITAGIVCWLGFTIKVPVIKLHKTKDPFGDAIVGGLICLGYHQSMQDARDKIYANLDQLVTDFDTGSLKNHPNNVMGYFAAMSLRDHIVVHGNPAHQPL